MKKIPIETVIAASALALGLALALAVTPPATWEAIGAFSEETWAGLALAGAGIIGAFFARPITSPASEPKKKLSSSIRKDGENGSVSTEALVWLTLWGIAALVALARWVALRGGAGLLLAFLVVVSGCGSALSAHATSAAVMGVALDGAYEVAEAHAVEATEACVTAGDEACVREVHASMVPVAIGLSGLEVAWSGYVSAIEVGHLSGASEALLEAMRSAAARMLSAYSLLAEALSRVGVALPAVPPMVLALVGAPS